MPTSETIEKRPRRRRVDSIVLNVTLDREALSILKEYCPPGRKGTGRLLGRLLYEHAARLEERQRLKESLTSVLEEKTTT
jgi:hypothetical protein